MEPLSPIVDVSWLSDRLGEPDLVVVDCRWKLGEPGAGERLHREGHVPGATFLDVDRDLSGDPGDDATHGRHPLPAARDFERAARRAGIGEGATVVAHDEAGEGGAARLWWLLRHFGHDRAAILDGGMRAWRAAGVPTETGQATPSPGDFRAHPREDDMAPLDEVRERALGGDPDLVLVDARAPERYRGDVEPVDPVAGHIPGAANLPFADLLEDGRFRSRDELQERLTAAGVKPGADVVAYCGSGVTASVLIAAAEAAGVDGTRLYAGSWSEWCRQGLPPAGDK
jgi:thiosulfate/3-mercaptopyruvate sulfurtransferase